MKKRNKSYLCFLWAVLLVINPSRAFAWGSESISGYGVGKLQIKRFTGYFFVSQWTGQGDIKWQSNSFCLLSKRGKLTPVDISASMDSFSNQTDTLALVNSLSPSKKSLPITITLKKLSTNSRVVFSRPFQKEKINDAQTNCYTDDYVLEFFISFRDLAELASGKYNNKFVWNLDNDNDVHLSQNFQIDFDMPDLVKISFSGDILVDQISGSSRTGTTHACVYVNDGGFYRVRAESDNFITNSYYLCNGAGGGNCQAGKIPYSLFFDDTPNRGSSYQFQYPSLFSRWFRGSSTPFSYCSAGNANAHIRVEVSEQDILKAPQASYSDVITIIVEPD